MFVVLDVDGTIADNSHREHHIKKKPKDWEAFHAPELVIKDPLIAGIERILTKFQDLKYTFVILTGRNESLRDTTMRWLNEKLSINIPDENLLMRPLGNMLNQAEYKREQLANFRNGLENKDARFLIIDNDTGAAEALSDFGVVLHAPKCWEVLFPVKASAIEEE